MKKRKGINQDQGKKAKMNKNIKKRNQTSPSIRKTISLIL